MYGLPAFFFLGPVIGAVVVYLIFRVQVWSRPDPNAVASHGLWVGIVGWMASSLQGAMSAGLLSPDPMLNNYPATPDQLFQALGWPVAACLAVHALGQLSYPRGKNRSKNSGYASPGIRDLLPRKLAWTVGAVLAYSAAAIAWIAWLPAYAPAPAFRPESYTGTLIQGQNGRIPGYELALWLAAALLLLALGTMLVLLLIAKRRPLETLDDADNQQLHRISANRLLRTVATIAAGLATIAGNFAVLPEPGPSWQPSWFNALGAVNMVVLLAMLWWPVPVFPSLLQARQATSARGLLADQGTHGAARLSVNMGVGLGALGGLAAVGGLGTMYALTQPANMWMLPIAVGLVAVLLLAGIAGGEVLLGRNYGRDGAPAVWPVRAVSRGLFIYAMASAYMLLAVIVFVAAGQDPAQPFKPTTWPWAAGTTVAAAAVGTLAIFAVRRRRGIPEGAGEAGLDAALKSISMYRIVRTLSAYCLGQAGVLLITSPEAWDGFFPISPGTFPVGPHPAVTAGMVLAVIAVITAIVPVRSLLRTIPRGNRPHTADEADAPGHAPMTGTAPGQSKLDP